jgi:uncharacterized membrane protein YfcA
VALNAASNLPMHGRVGNVKWHSTTVFTAAGVAGAFLGSTLGKMMETPWPDAASHALTGDAYMCETYNSRLTVR